MTQCAKIIVVFIANVDNVFPTFTNVFFYFLHVFFYVFNVFFNFHLNVYYIYELDNSTAVLYYMKLFLEYTR